MTRASRIIDLHEDISLYLMATGDRLDDDKPGRHADIPKYSRAGVRLVFASIFPGDPTWSPRLSSQLSRGYGGEPMRAYWYRDALGSALEHVKVYYRLVDTSGGRVRLVEGPEDLGIVETGGSIGLLLSLEGAEPLGEPDDLLVFYRLGVRSVALTWNYDNRYAASCMSRRDYGLTGSGEELVRLANELGVIIDVSHASKRASIEAAEASKLPVIASHSNYSRVKRHPRNVDDEVIEAIKSKGGVVGVTLITSTLPRPTLDGVVDVIISMYEVFGADVIAIGTDFFGIERTPEGLEAVDKLPALLEALRERGIKDSDVEKIAWGNALRVIREHASRWPKTPRWGAQPPSSP